MANERQIPKTQEYFCNPLYWDIVYAYIQVNSEWDGVEGHPRIFPKKKANFTKIGDYLGLTRQTVSKRFQDLENGQKDKEGLNLIKKLDNGDYEIIILDSSVATLINNDTLRVLTSACNNYTISIYVYLYSRWMAQQQQEFKFTYDQLKHIIGIGKKSDSNDYIVKDILNLLMMMELVTLKCNVELSENGGFKTIYSVVGMKDTVDDKIEQLSEQSRIERLTKKKC